ncbi:MAG: hypothetical protein NT116_02895 [Candidatus Parcubacteria bacterium]|nr:hypothetical protein [Candidatus Parcubacteria bacterium]
MEQKVKNYQLWYKILLIVGLIGIIDIATRSIIKQNYGFSDFGFVSFVFLYTFKFLFGAKVASLVAVFISLIMSFALIWLIAAWVIKSKIKKLSATKPE